jgi:hypothetical protein
MDACASVLKVAGVGKVYFLCVATGVDNWKWVLFSFSFYFENKGWRTGGRHVILVEREKRSFFFAIILKCKK